MGVDTVGVDTWESTAGLASRVCVPPFSRRRSLSREDLRPYHRAMNPSRERRPAVVVLVGVIAIAALLVAAWSSGRRRTADLPAGSPQATVQAYLRAVSDSDRVAARAQLADGLAQQCLLESMTFPTVDRAVLVTTTDRGDTATVVVNVTERWGSGLFDLNDATARQTFELVRTPAGWRIGTMPWPLYACSPTPYPPKVPGTVSTVPAVPTVSTVSTVPTVPIEGPPPVTPMTQTAPTASTTTTTLSTSIGAAR